MNLETLKYPIGQFEAPSHFDENQVQVWISDIEKLPDTLFELTHELSENELNMPYRPEGWTIRQVIHHVVDSHINSYVRFKLALTEEKPTIRPYFEDRWAELPDMFATPVSVSLQLLKSLHQRWVILLKSMTYNDLQRTFIHPEMGEVIPLWDNIGLYSWHSRHHLAHIQNALKLLQNL